MKIIGVTGGIGSGKSTVSNLLEVMGIPVYIADWESKKLTNSSPLLREQLMQRFGTDLYSSGDLDKALLAALIFENEENLRYVNSVIHPAVWTDFQQWTQQYAGYDFVAIESAILFESGFDASTDIKVNVSAPLETRIRRVEKRDNAPRESIVARIKNQISDEERNRLSDYVIVNDDNQALIPQVEGLINIILI
jgi:dephospho-CoA kinase